MNYRAPRRTRGSPPVTRSFLIPTAGGHPGQAEQFFVAQDFLARQFLPVPPRGAVETAQIAAVGDGDPQVIDLARQNIFHLIDYTLNYSD